MNTTTITKRTSSYSFFPIMEALVEMDSHLQNALFSYALYDSNEFLERMALTIDSAYECALKCHALNTFDHHSKDWLSTQLDLLLDEIEQLTVFTSDISAERCAEISDHLLHIRLRAQFIRKEFGCFDVIDAIRSSFRTYANIGENCLIDNQRGVLLSNNWRRIHSMVQRSFYEWQSTHNVVNSISCAHTQKFLNLSDQTLHALNELSMSVKLKSPGRFVANFHQLMELYQPYCQNTTTMAV